MTLPTALLFLSTGPSARYFTIEQFFNNHINPYVILIAIFGFYIQIHQFRKLKSTTKAYQTAVGNTIAKAKGQTVLAYLNSISPKLIAMRMCMEKGNIYAARIVGEEIREKLTFVKLKIFDHQADIQSLLTKLALMLAEFDSKIDNKKYVMDSLAISRSISEMVQQISELSDPLDNMEVKND